MDRQNEDIKTTAKMKRRRTTTTTTTALNYSKQSASVPAGEKGEGKSRNKEERDSKDNLEAHSSPNRRIGQHQLLIYLGQNGVLRSRPKEW